jgi:hypothetical protein
LTPKSRRSARSSDETGAGLLGTSFGVFLFLLLLLVAVQVTFDLYARSAVGAAAFDAVSTVAGGTAGGAGDSVTATTAAEARARDILGRYGERAEFEWTLSADVVALRVTVPNPGFLPPMFRVADRETTRTVRMRVEREL